MTINRTTLLDLPLPVTGTESNAWGDVVNYGLTEYLDISIAGSLDLSTDADVLLASTEGTAIADNIGATTAQYAVLRCTGSRTVTRNITAPAWAISSGTLTDYSKTYIVVNETTGGQNIVLRATNSVTPTYTTGVTIVPGERAVCVWNGSDFVKAGGVIGGSNTQVQYNNAGVLGGIANATSDGTTLSMTSPKVITGINDTNGNELLKVTATGSAVNELTLANAATGNAPTLSATGDDTNIGINITPKGSGVVTISNLAVTTIDATNIEVTNIKAKDGTAAGSIADSTGVVTLGSSVLTTTDINGGTIDNTTIGGSTAAAGSFTTLTTSSTVTLNGGTANGVAYLNGSKVLTTGSALTFDGSVLGVNSAGDSDFKLTTSNTGSGSTDGLLLRINSTGSEAYLWNWEPSSVLIFGANAAEQMRLTSTGLGIGTSSPQRKLDVAAVPYSASQLGGLRISNTSSVATSIAEFLLGTESTGVPFTSIRTGNDANSFMTFFTGSGPTERARIDSSGNFMVATTTNLSRITAETSSVAGNFASNNTAGAGTRYHAVWYESGTERGSITSNGSATAYNTSSDYRLKDNQQPLTGSGAFIDALQPKTWEWKADGSKGVGFIAHEVQAVSPGSVVGEKDAVDADGKPVMQAMEYGSAEFIANIIAELQSLRARVAQLEAK